MFESIVALLWSTNGLFVLWSTVSRDLCKARPKKVLVMSVAWIFLFMMINSYLNHNGCQNEDSSSNNVIVFFTGFSAVYNISLYPEMDTVNSQAAEQRKSVLRENPKWTVLHESRKFNVSLQISSLVQKPKNWMNWLLYGELIFGGAWLYHLPVNDCPGMFYITMNDGQLQPLIHYRSFHPVLC